MTLGSKWWYKGGQYPIGLLYYANYGSTTGMWLSIRNRVIPQPGEWRKDPTALQKGIQLLKWEV